jgi:hypothetical protein
MSIFAGETPALRKKIRYSTNNPRKYGVRNTPFVSICWRTVREIVRPRLDLGQELVPGVVGAHPIQVVDA